MPNQTRDVNSSKKRLSRIFTFLFDSKNPHQVRLRVVGLMKSVFQEHFRVLSLMETSFKEKNDVSLDYCVQEYGFNMEVSPGEAEVGDIMDVLKHEIEHRLAKDVVHKLHDVLEKCDSMSLDDLTRKINEIKVSKVAPSEHELYSVKDAYEQKKRKPLGLMTGIKQLDNTIVALEKGNPLIIAAWTGSYKTQTCINLSYNNVVNLGYNIAYFSTEVPKDQIYYYFLARHSYNKKFIDRGQPIDHFLIQKTQLTPEQEHFLFEVVEPDLNECDDYGSFVPFDEWDLNSNFSRDNLERFIVQYPIEFDAFVIDHIQELKYSSTPKEAGHIPQQEVLNYYVREFVRLGQNCGGRRLLPILCSQTNREGWKRAVANGGAYDLGALSDANFLEKEGYYIIFLYLDEALKEANEVKISLVKHRGGPTILSPFVTKADPRFCYLGDDIDDYQAAQDSMSISFNEDIFKM